MSLKFLIVDDHPIVLDSTCSHIQKQYPDALIVRVKTASEVRTLVESAEEMPNLLVLDLNIPKTSEEKKSRATIGISLLRDILELDRDCALAIVVLSAYVKNLRQLCPIISKRERKFGVIDKRDGISKMLHKIALVLDGECLIPPKLLRSPEIKPDWIKAVRLIYEEGYTRNKAAEIMNVVPRTISNYFGNLRSVLNIDEESSDKDNNREVYRKLKEQGLLDDLLD